MDNTFERIKRAEELPQLPQVMLKLIKACGSEKTDVEELTRIISTDPALASKLLQIISSPYINLPRQVNTIKTAVVYLGLDAIRNLAISSSAMHFFKFSRALPGFDITRFWYHSYKCGILARYLAAETGHPNPDEFFLAGLLHDIGRLVLMRTFPKGYARVLEKAGKGAALFDAEREQFKVDTPQVSAWLFTRWQLNPISSDAVRFISEPAERIGEELDHVKILYTANALAKNDSEPDLENMAGLFPISPLRLEQILGRAGEETENMARSMGITPDGSGNTAAGRGIAMEIKDYSLFFGTLTALVAASDRAALLEAVQKGLEILFQVPRVFFFLLDREKKSLAGTCHPGDRHRSIVQSIAISLDNGDSLVAEAAVSRTVKNSFDQNKLAVSDAQIIRLMSSKGLYCIPITARGNALGTMALGVDKDLARTLALNLGILELFSTQTGICLENLTFHQTYAQDVNEKKMEAYAALTDKVIHEVNNPIAIIKNYLETLSLKLPEKHPAQEELSLIGEEIYRVSTLLDGLSSFSKPRVVGVETVDINQTCVRVMEVMKKSILLPRKIKTRIDADQKIPALKMDGDGLKQVLINLVKNAAEAMETGGEIHITTALIPGSSRVVVDEKKRLPDWVEIRIKDSGPGIAAHIRERLFEPYNTSKSGSNSGLGLAIVHSIVKEMKGKITCEKSGGPGHLFFRLSAHDIGRKTPAAKQAMMRPERAKTGEILVAEGLISPDDVEKVLAVQEKNRLAGNRKRLFGMVLCDLSLVTPMDNYCALEEHGKLFSVEDYLVRESILTRSGLDQVSAQAGDEGVPLISFFLDKKVMDKSRLQKILFDLFYIPFRSVSDIVFEKESRGSLAQVIGPKAAEEHQCIPLQLNGASLLVGITDPSNLIFLQDLDRTFPQYRFTPVFIPFSGFTWFYRLLYAKSWEGKKRLVDLSLLMKSSVTVSDPRADQEKIFFLFRGV